MAYGMMFKNSSDVVVLDSEFARLVVLQKGTWSSTGGATINFASAITSSEPPLIFVRPNQSGILSFCQVIGSAGAWTGFTFIGSVGVSTSGNWFCSAFQSRPTAKYGFRIWDASSKLIFDSGTPCAQFSKTLSSWTYLGAEQTNQGQTRLSWTAPFSLNGGDYMLLNNIAMDIAGGTSRQGNLYANWQYNNDRLVISAVGVDLQIYLYISVVFAKPIT